MGQVRHGSATTTFAVRAANTAIASFDLGAELGAKYQPEDGAKWRKQQTIKDLKTGSREPRSTVLSQAVEGMIVAFRRQTLLPLDDCLFPSANDPTSNTIITPSISPKTGHIALPQR